MAQSRKHNVNVRETLKGQYWIIEAGVRLGYDKKLDPKGICQGFAVMGGQAILVRDTETFDERLENIFMLLSQHKLVSQKAEQSSTNQEKSKNTSKEQLYVLPDVLAFFDGIITYQERHIAARLTNQNRHLSQFHTLRAQPILNKKLEELGGMVDIDLFTGAYTEKEVTNYLIGLVKTINKSPLKPENPLIIFLTNCVHTIVIGYDHASQTWYLIDANGAPTLQIAAHKSEKLSKSIIYAFENLVKDNTDTESESDKAENKDKIAIFSSAIFGVKPDEKSLKKIVQDWRTSKSLTMMHTISEKKIKLVDSVNDTWLDVAIKNGDAKTAVKIIKTMRIDPNTSRKQRVPPLSQAANVGDVALMQELLLLKKIDPNKLDLNGETPLALAAISGHHEAVALLLNTAKIEPNKPCEDGDTPFICAVRSNNPQTISLFLGREDIDLGAINKLDETAISVAASQGNADVADLLIKSNKFDFNNVKESEYTTALVIAARTGNLPFVQTLLNVKTIDVNRADASGDTPLMTAVQANNIDVVRALLNVPNIDLSAKNNDEETAITIATRKNNEEILDLLRRAKQEQKNTPQASNNKKPKKPKASANTLFKPDRPPKNSRTQETPPILRPAKQEQENTRQPNTNKKHKKPKASANTLFKQSPIKPAQENKSPGGMARRTRSKTRI